LVTLRIGCTWLIARLGRWWISTAAPVYPRSLAETLGEERGAEFIANVERRADELHSPARHLFSNWLDLAASA
jgi:hypothetical protein